MTGAELGTIISMAVLLLCSGISSGTETAYFSLGAAQLEDFRSGDRLKRLAASLMERAPRLLLVILILNNAINIAYFSLASWWAAQYQHNATSAGVIAVGSLSCLILFGEIFPKVLASSAPAFFARLLAPPVWLVTLLLSPLCRVIQYLLGRIIDEEPGPSRSRIVTGDELKMVIEHTRDHGVVSELVHDRLVEVVDLSSTPALKVMTHRLDCPTLPTTTSSEAAVEALRDQPSPYIMMLDENEDCVGLLAAQDLLRGGKPSKRMRKPLYIPGNAQLAQVIDLFRESGQTAGVVVDEYGGTQGLLTLAHIGNELLGPGTSHDLPELPPPQQVSEDRWQLSGRLPLEEWEPILAPEDSAGCTTIGGFVSKMLGALPQEGDQVLYRNLLFHVDQVAARRIKLLTVQKLPEREARRITRGYAGANPWP